MPITRRKKEATMSNKHETTTCVKNAVSGSALRVLNYGKVHLETFNGTGWAYNHNSTVKPIF